MVHHIFRAPILLSCVACATEQVGLSAELSSLMQASVVNADGSISLEEPVRDKAQPKDKKAVLLSKSSVMSMEFSHSKDGISIGVKNTMETSNSST